MTCSWVVKQTGGRGSENWRENTGVTPTLVLASVCWGSWYVLFVAIGVVNPLRTKRSPFYLNTQLVPLGKHLPSEWPTEQNSLFVLIYKRNINALRAECRIS